MPLLITDRFAEIGSSGLNTFSGTIHEEQLRELQDPARRAATYRQMLDNDAIVGASIYLLDQLVRQVPWRVEPAEGDKSPQGEIAADFIDSCFKDLDRPFKDTISEILGVVPIGWAWHETVLKRRLGPQSDPQLQADGTFTEELPSSRFNDGKIGWDKFAGRAQETLHKWEFDAHGNVLAFVQRAPPRFQEVRIPLAQSLHFRTSARGNNPEGQSALRRAFRSWYFKTIMEEIQAIGVERDLAGLPIFGVPGEYMKAGTLPSNLQAERATFEKMVRNIRQGKQASILYPLVYDRNGNLKFKLDLMASGGRRQFDIIKLMQYYDQRIAMMVFADVILLGHEKVGSFALDSSKTHRVAMVAGTTLDLIEDQFNRRAIPRLLAMNGMPIDQPARLVHGDIETLELSELAQYIQALAGAGFPLFPSEDGELERVLLEEAGLPGGVEAL